MQVRIMIKRTERPTAYATSEKLLETRGNWMNREWASGSAQVNENYVDAIRELVIDEKF